MILGSGIQIVVLARTGLKLAGDQSKVGHEVTAIVPRLEGPFVKVGFGGGLNRLGRPVLRLKPLDHRNALGFHVIQKRAR